MIEFFLNNKLITTSSYEGITLLDFIRNEKKLKGTKSACREGDCGSCTVIIGNFSGESFDYNAVASCIMPLGNVHGKHVITIEGLNMAKISPIQQTLVDFGAIQCGYCTPGIVLSLTAYTLSAKEYNFNDAKESIGGNICRCTGYKAIENAIDQIVSDLNVAKQKKGIKDLIKGGYIPEYFIDITKKLKQIKSKELYAKGTIVGGGTDLFVQNPDGLNAGSIRLISEEKKYSGIEVTENTLKIGAACKMADLEENNLLCDKIPGFESFMKLIASKLIRNMATVAGNIVNASPIGDLSIMFLALNASLIVGPENKKDRNIKLRNFFKSYKKVDLKSNELIKYIQLELPSSGCKFNFEKVSKRRHLDIATVNSAMLIMVEKEIIKKISISVGGVSPIPLYLKRTCEVIQGKALNQSVLREAVDVFNSEIAPIDDVRGSANYKRLLARQLFFAHFIKLFPELFELEKLVLRD